MSCGPKKSLKDTLGVVGMCGFGFMLKVSMPSMALNSLRIFLLVWREVVLMVEEVGSCVAVSAAS